MFTYRRIISMSKTNRSSVLVSGIGDKGLEYPCCDGKHRLKEYDLWKSMLYRCTEKEWAKHPTYTGTTCSENFKSYTFFYEWCNKQVGFNNRDENGKAFQLDKDLLIKGNKHYSEDTCVFVPQRLNMLLTKRLAKRGEYPIGVSKDKKSSKFRVRCGDGYGVYRHIGQFSTPQEAFQVYKVFKEAIIKKMAEDYKEELDEKTYNAMMLYVVNEND